MALMAGLAIILLKIYGLNMRMVIPGLEFLVYSFPQLPVFCQALI